MNKYDDLGDVRVAIITIALSFPRSWRETFPQLVKRLEKLGYCTPDGGLYQDIRTVDSNTQYHTPAYSIRYQVRQAAMLAKKRYDFVVPDHTGQPMKFADGRLVYACDKVSDSFTNEEGKFIFEPGYGPARDWDDGEWVWRPKTPRQDAA